MINNEYPPEILYMSTIKLITALEKIIQENNHYDHLRQPLQKWLNTADLKALYHINVYRLADTLNLDRNTLLRLFIIVTYHSVFNINWDFHSPFCNAVVASHNRFSESTTENFCPVKKERFRNELNSTVEVTFTPQESYIEFPDDFIKLHNKIIMQQAMAGTLEMPDPYVTGFDCLHVPEFLDLFYDDVPAADENLYINNVTLMFTDIKGSTQLYDTLGDATAYGLVRDHFNIMFKTVSAHDGIIIKTIGDAVMASFKKPEHAVAAALAIQSEFAAFNTRENLPGEIIIKIGMHSGSTIVVNLNRHIDYFGQTVNLTARIQNVAQGGDITISEEMRNNPNVIALLKQHVSSLTKIKVHLKGIEQDKIIYRI